MYGYIYKTTNLLNGKIYVGKKAGEHYKTAYTTYFSIFMPKKALYNTANNPNKMYKENTTKITFCGNLMSITTKNTMSSKNQALNFFSRLALKAAQGTLETINNAKTSIINHTKLYKWVM